MNKHPNHPDNAPSFLINPIGFIYWHSTSYKRCAHPSCQAKVERIESAGWQVGSALLVALVIAWAAVVYL